MQSTFWREWKSKLEDQKRFADQARELEQIIPGIEIARFLSRDMVYIKSVMFSFIDTVKQEKKHILKDAVMLADAYGLHRIEVSPYLLLPSVPLHMLALTAAFPLFLGNTTFLCLHPCV